MIRLFASYFVVLDSNREFNRLLIFCQYHWLVLTGKYHYRLRNAICISCGPHGKLWR